MSDTHKPPGGPRPNRRKEIFPAVRGSKLTEQRGGWSGRPQGVALAATKDPIATAHRQSVRRVRLGNEVEDESERTQAQDAPRYSEPND